MYVGPSKESFRIVEASHSVNGVCLIFGLFVKFVVLLSECEPIEYELLPKRQKLNGDTPNGLPSALRENTRKDKLFNELLKFLEGKEVGWNDPEVYGKPFLLDLCSVLWYLDGHHEVFASRSCPIPMLFKSFAGFNKPELSKHRKRSISNMNRDKLLAYSAVLQGHIMSSWMQQSEWSFLKEGLLSLIESLASYASYLSVRNKMMKQYHSSPEPPVSFSDSSSLQFINSSSNVSPLLSALDNAVASKPDYHKLCVRDFSPQEKRRRYLFICELQKGLSNPIFLFTYTHPSNVGNYHFVWKAPSILPENSSTQNLKIVQEIKKEIPVYHTRTMRKEFFSLYGGLSPESKPYLLHSIYCALTDDSSASRTTPEKKIDAHVQEALAAEDVDIVVDSRQLNSNGQDNFSLFWAKCNEYLTNCTTVHKHRHGTSSFMDKAISVRDLTNQVAKICPNGTPNHQSHGSNITFCREILILEQLYVIKVVYKLNTWYKNVNLENLIDAHYCSALFRYLRKYSIRLQDISRFVCIDDKHRIKVGEPGLPIAAVERDKEVIVSLNETYTVGDHDFAKFSFIASVSLLIDIPETIMGSWYRGQVFVGIKDAIFEPSSPRRHATELYQYLLPHMTNRYGLFLYSDGGPDHRLTYVSVQLSLIALFLNFDLDILIACRTAPSHSWANPVERIMSIINLGLQCIGIMRTRMGNEAEKFFEGCKNMKDLRMNGGDYQHEIIETLKPAKQLLNTIMQRLELKEKSFEIRVVVKVLSAKFYFHKPVTVHLELYLFYCFIHFVLYIGQY